MDRWRYVARELRHRSGRSLATAAGIAVAVLAAVLLAALANSYSRALEAPMKTVGADVIVQLTGDIPPKLEGLVFPHPNALLPAKAVAGIRKEPGVVSVTRAVYLWELAPDHYQSVLGLEAGETGLDGLNGRLLQGRPLRAGDHAALLDSDFAGKNGLKAGDDIVVGGDRLPVAGIVDAARGGKVVRADVYLPLAVSQALAAAAPQVQALYAFGADDANMLLVKADRRRMEAVVERIKQLVGKKAIVSSEISFRETLESALFLSERMGLVLSLVVAVFAVAFVLRATASAVNERRREMAVLQALGWRWRDVHRQVLLENTVLALTGTLAGLALAAFAAWAIGNIEVTMEMPWDLSSTPHFIPEAAVDRRQSVTVPLQLAWQVLAAAGLGGIFAGAISALAALSTRRPQPWSLLRSE